MHAAGPTALRMILGKQLQALREKAEMSFDEAAAAILSSPFTIRRMERAEGGFKPLTVKSLLIAYGVTDTDEIEAFLSLCRDAARPGWWHSYGDVLPEWFRTFVGLEEAASLIRGYEPHWVPGLLQTEDYARASLQTGAPGAPEAEVERRVMLRLARQKILDRPDPPHLWVVIDETVLRRAAATTGASAMRTQIDRLIEATERPGITLQVLTFAAGMHAAAFGLFYLLRFPDKDMPDLVYSESMTSAWYIDKPREATAYLEVLDRVSAQAAPADSTARLLRTIRKEI
ncbi:MAG: helix-turn-helix domain-containing protein [Trebonia sp.]